LGRPWIASMRCQRTTQRLHLGCHRNPAPQTTGAGATTTGPGATTTGAAGATTTGPPLGRHAPHGLRCQPGPQPPAALAPSSDMSESKIAADAADNNFGPIKLTSPVLDASASPPVSVASAGQLVQLAVKNIAPPWRRRKRHQGGTIGRGAVGIFDVDRGTRSH
jgi:hypothetical protein